MMFARPLFSRHANVSKVIYIQENFYSMHMRLLGFFLDEGLYELIVWLYPESKLAHLAGMKLEAGLEVSGKPITTYGDDIVPSRTIRQSLSNEHINLFESNRRVITQNVDSIVLYKPSEFEWTACTVGHEGMLLVNNDSYLEQIKAEGFSATTETPDTGRNRRPLKKGLMSSKLIRIFEFLV